MKMNRAFVVPGIPAKDATNDIDSFRVPRSEPISVPNMNLRSTPLEKICTDEEFRADRHYNAFLP